MYLQKYWFDSAAGNADMWTYIYYTVVVFLKDYTVSSFYFPDQF